MSRTKVIIASGAALAAAAVGAAFALAGSGHPAQGATVNRTAKVTHAHAAAPPLRVLSVTPADGSRGVNGTDPVTVTFNEPLPAGAPLPTLSPAIAGTWQRSGDSVTFTPQAGFTAGTHVRVTVPDRASGVRSGYSAGFTTGTYSTLRLQEVLAQLGYLPMTWTGVLGGTVTPGSEAAQLGAAYSAPAGSFARQGGYPSSLYGFWKEGAPNLLDTGAIMGFEADHGLPVDGVAGPRVWAALMSAAAKDQRNTHGYSYAMVSESIPETLTIWHDGRNVFSSLANTGISDAPTALGTYPVFEKLPFQVMKGTNPDGTHYADPVEWVSYFNGGDAVHFFPRGSFGWPQSLGCVELPYSAAEEAYPVMPYGTLVTVNA